MLVQGACAHDARELSAGAPQGEAPTAAADTIAVGAWRPPAWKAAGTRGGGPRTQHRRPRARAGPVSRALPGNLPLAAASAAGRKPKTLNPRPRTLRHRP